MERTVCVKLLFCHLLSVVGHLFFSRLVVSVMDTLLDNCNGHCGVGGGVSEFDVCRIEIVRNGFCKSVVSFCGQHPQC